MGTKLQQNNKYNNFKFYLYICFLLTFPFSYGYKFSRVINGINYILNTDNHTATMTDIYEAPSDIIEVPSEILWKNEKFNVTTISIIFGDHNSIVNRIQSLYIPNSVKNIFVLKGFENLRELRLPDTSLEIMFDAFSHCPSLEYVYIPPKVKSIDSNAFTDCTNLKTLVIGSGDTNINSTSFASFSLFSPEIQLIVLEAQEPPKYFDAFKEYIDTAILMVPVGSKSFYENSDWRYFDKIIEYDVDYFNNYVPDFARRYSPHKPLESNYQCPFNIMDFSEKVPFEEVDDIYYTLLKDFSEAKLMLSKFGFSYRKSGKGEIIDGDIKIPCICDEYRKDGISVFLCFVKEGSNEEYDYYYSYVVKFDSQDEMKLFLKDSEEAGMGCYEGYYSCNGFAESGIQARVKGNLVIIGDEGMDLYDICIP